MAVRSEYPVFDRCSVTQVEWNDVTVCPAPVRSIEIQTGTHHELQQRRSQKPRPPTPKRTPIDANYSRHPYSGPLKPSREVDDGMDINVPDQDCPVALALGFGYTRHCGGVFPSKISIDLDETRSLHLENGCGLGYT